jgi:hypothetical protein
VAEVERPLSVVEELESVVSANLQRAPASASPSSKKPSLENWFDVITFVDTLLP